MTCPRYGLAIVACALGCACQSRAPSSSAPQSDAAVPPSSTGDASVPSEMPLQLADGGLPDAPVPSWVSVGSFDPETYRLWDDTQGVSREAARIFCECETGQSDGQALEDCVDRDAPRLAPPLAECTKAMLSNEPRARDAIACRLAARKAYVECVSPLGCTGLFGPDLTGCDLDRIVAEDACPDVPYQTVIAVEQNCYGRSPGPTWQCDDGDLIKEEWYCDFQRDCADGSDETACGHGAAE